MPTKTFRSILLAVAILFAPLAARVALAQDAAPAQSDMAVTAQPSAAPPAALAPAKPDLSNPVATIGEAVKDAQAKNWMALASIILMAAAYYARRYAPSASFFHTFKGGLVLAIGAGLMSAVGEGLYGGKLDLNTLLAGLAATASAAFAIAHPTPAKS